MCTSWQSIHLFLYHCVSIHPSILQPIAYHSVHINPSRKNTVIIPAYISASLLWFQWLCRLWRYIHHETRGCDTCDEQWNLGNTLPPLPCTPEHDRNNTPKYMQWIISNRLWLPAIVVKAKCLSFILWFWHVQNKGSWFKITCLKNVEIYDIFS